MADVSIVYLLRHGRTRLNAAGALRGRIDVELDEVGIAEAAALGTLFAPVSLSAVVSSPLVRARSTAAAVARGRDIAIRVEERFGDRDYGPWAGSLQREVERRFGSLDSAEGVEPLEHFAARVADALNAAATPGGRVAVVAHDAVNRVAMQTLVPALATSGALRQPTGCWNLLERHGQEWLAPIVAAVPGDGQHP